MENCVSVPTVSGRALSTKRAFTDKIFDVILTLIEKCDNTSFRSAYCHGTDLFWKKRNKKKVGFVWTNLVAWFTLIVFVKKKMLKGFNLFGNGRNGKRNNTKLSSEIWFSYNNKQKRLFCKMKLLSLMDNLHSELRSLGVVVRFNWKERKYIINLFPTYWHTICKKRSVWGA